MKQKIGDLAWSFQIRLKVSLKKQRSKEVNYFFSYEPGSVLKK